MKAMGYAQQVLQTLSLSGNTLTGNGKKGNENYTSSVDLSGLHVANADKDGSDNNIEQTYAKKSDLLNAIYPVGSIYMSTNNNSPQNFLGGTWVRIEGRFLLGAGSGYNVNATGGEATHTLTTDEMPSHNHDISRIEPGGSGGNYTVLAKGTQSANYWDSAHTYTIPNLKMGYRGGGSAHNNMPPYYVVYIRRRTA